MGERDEVDRWLDEIVAMSAQTERHLFTPEQEARVREIVSEVLATADLAKSKASIDAYAKLRDKAAIEAIHLASLGLSVSDGIPRQSTRAALTCSELPQFHDAVRQGEARSLRGRLGRLLQALRLPLARKRPL